MLPVSEGDFPIWMSSIANIVSHPRCLCSVGKVAGKGATIIEYLIQVFFKRLDSQPVDNKQVGGYSQEWVSCVFNYYKYMSILMVSF